MISAPTLFPISGFRRALRRHLNRAALLLGAAMTVAVPIATPVHAQDETRLRKIEQEVRALQRKVFPGGEGKYFEPEITAPQPNATTPPISTTGPVTDLLSRMDAVESALQSMTAQVEVNSNALRLLNARVDQLEAGAGTGMPLATSSPAPAPRGALENNMSAMTTTGASPAAAAAAPALVERPQTGDIAEDTYVYGYRLWDAGRYAEARKQLQIVVDKYPANRRASWARNLIGRSWLDEGQAGKAGEAFLQNYLDNRGGERAPDSLVYLARATLKLGNKSKSCEALAEFRRVYPSEAAGRLSSIANETARDAGCN